MNQVAFIFPHLSMFILLTIYCPCALTQTYISQEGSRDTLRIMENGKFKYIKGAYWPYHIEDPSTLGTWIEIDSGVLVLNTYQARSQSEVLGYNFLYTDSIDKELVFEFIDQKGSFAPDFFPVLVDSMGTYSSVKDSNMQWKLGKIISYNIPDSKPAKILVHRFGVFIDTFDISESFPLNHFKFFISRANSGPRYMNHEHWIRRGGYIFSDLNPDNKFIESKE
ncbi:MAG: hypothetical protein AAFW00_23460 [Bacteroidota bacterium]